MALHSAHLHLSVRYAAQVPCTIREASPEATRCRRRSRCSRRADIAASRHSGHRHLPASYVAAAPCLISGMACKVPTGAVAIPVRNPDHVLSDGGVGLRLIEPV